MQIAVTYEALEQTMKEFSSNLFLILVLGIISLGFTAMPAFAQDDEKLQALQRTVENQQKQLSEQRRLILELKAQMESLADAGKKKTVQAPIEDKVSSDRRETQSPSTDVPRDEIAGLEHSRISAARR